MGTAIKLTPDTPNVANFNSAAILNEIVNQATGKNRVSAIATSDFTSVATTALELGMDPLLNAISQVLSRTIFLSDLIQESLRVYIRIT